MSKSNIFPALTEKTVITVVIAQICEILTKEKLNCLNSHEIQIGELKIRWRQCAMTLHGNGMFLRNGYVAFEIAVCKYFICTDLHFCFPFSRSPMFTEKTTIFLDDGLYRKMSAYRHGFLSQWKGSISCTNFCIMTTGQQNTRLISWVYWNSTIEPLITTFLSHRNQCIDLQSKPIDWFLHDRKIGLYRLGLSLKWIRLLSKIFERRSTSPGGIKALKDHQQISLLISNEFEQIL